MFVIQFDDSYFSFLNKTSFKFVPTRADATVFNKYEDAEEVLKILKTAGINYGAICVHRTSPKQKPMLRLVR